MNIFAASVGNLLKPVKQFLEDPSVTEIMINGPMDIYIERGGILHRTEAKFESSDHLMSAIVNLAQFVGRRIGPDRPRLDGRLPDGSRIHAIIPPISRNGPALAIRKFFKRRLSLEDLVGFGTLTSLASSFLQICVQAGKNILVSGGTGSGKTTILNILSGLILPEERIITIEDSAELQLQQDHVLSLESSPSNRSGQGEITIRDLLHSSLRLRPDRIIIGEIRSGEALDLLQALNTGHGGSMSTIHANSPIEALSRLETLALMGGIEIPLVAVRSQVSQAIDIIVQTARLADGSRKIVCITEVAGLDEKQNYTTSDIFAFKFIRTKGSKSSESLLKPTGLLPSFKDELIQLGYDLPKEMILEKD
jgi:pilus assembly protein CpaF